MRQSPRSPEDDALAQIGKIIKPLSPHAVGAFKKRIDDLFARVGFVDQPKTPEQARMFTKISDLFASTSEDTPQMKAVLTRASRVLQMYFDPKIHSKMRDHDFVFKENTELTVGDVLQFRLVQQRRSFWYSQDLKTGKSQGIKGMNIQTLTIIQERLLSVGAELQSTEDRKFKPHFYWN